MASVAPLPEISIGSPISGWVWPLSATPDAAFGQGLMGEGLAIDPLVGEVRAPFDGVVTTLNPSRHAVVLRHPSGLELLVHVGVDTVALGGAGFEALVTIGDQVRAGDGLLRFDLDAVALAAKSLVSPVILLNGDAFALVSRHEGGAVQAGEVLFSARPRPGPDGAKSGPSPKAALSGSVTLGFLHGLHARPAAAIARLAKQADITGRLVFEGREASVRSVAASGPTAHVAIIAGSLGLPLLTSAGEGLKAVRAGEMLFLDADRGEVRRNAPPEALAAARLKVLARKTQALSEAITAQEPALTTDGVRIEVLANLGAAAEASAAVKAGAEGCGLLRTEFLFMDRPTPPTEEEQRADYQAVLDGLDGRPLVIRTLDPGGDKPIAYLPDLDEANPALGLRGVRMSLHRPDLLQTQLRAILRLAPRPLVSIMIPMVTGLGELEAVRAALDLAARDLGLDPGIALGLMIETPASVLKADRLAQKADFFSLGTNDLTQYLLAMDRTNPHLAKAADALHPAVLRAIAMTCEAATARACKVSVCGGLASDLVAIPLLIGLGVRRLSCTVAVIPRVKQLIRTLDLAQCESLARQALDLDEADAVRKLVARQESLA